MYAKEESVEEEIMGSIQRLGNRVKGIHNFPALKGVVQFRDCYDCETRIVLTLRTDGAYEGMCGTCGDTVVILPRRSWEDHLVP